MSDGPLFLSMAFAKFELSRHAECLDESPHEGPRNEADPGRLHVSPSQPSAILPGDEKSLSDHIGTSGNSADESYHPESYKRRFCQEFTEEQGCQKKETCGLAHSELELRMTPLHLLRRDESFDLFWLKSEFCPFRTEHDEVTCVYAHGWGDFKRPFFESQQPLLCPLWNAASNEENQGDRNGVARRDKYASGCPRGFDCDKCHGPKELECHPLMRKGLGDAKICGGPPAQFRHFYPQRPALSLGPWGLEDYLEFTGVERPSRARGIPPPASAKPRTQTWRISKKSYFSGSSILEDENEDSVDSQDEPDDSSRNLDSSKNTRALSDGANQELLGRLSEPPAHRASCPSREC